MKAQSRCSDPDCQERSLWLLLLPFWALRGGRNNSARGVRNTPWEFHAGMLQCWSSCCSRLRPHLWKQHQGVIVVFPHPLNWPSPGICTVFHPLGRRQRRGLAPKLLRLEGGGKMQQNVNGGFRERDWCALCCPEWFPFPKRRRAQALWHYTILGQWKSHLLCFYLGHLLAHLCVEWAWKLTSLFFLDLVLNQLAALSWGICLPGAGHRGVGAVCAALGHQAGAITPTRAPKVASSQQTITHWVWGVAQH